MIIDDICAKFSRIIEIRHKPTVDHPWNELYYDKDEEPFEFLNFFSTIDNVASLNLYRLPFLFRGQAKYDWSLKPKLYRILEKCPLDEALRLEYDTIRYFQQNSRTLLSPNLIPKQESIGDWLALMQHYSTPTRLLDWTTSFNVALYFAVAEEPFNCDGAIWFVETKSMSSAMEGLSELSIDEQAIMSSEREYIDYGLQAPFKIDTFETDYKTERMIPQKSIFTISTHLFTDHAYTIGKSLIELSKSRKCMPLTKVILTPKAKKAIRKHLYKQNISALTLFPGIDGIGRSINEMVILHNEMFYIK